MFPLPTAPLREILGRRQAIYMVLIVLAVCGAQAHERGRAAVSGR